MMQPDGQRSVAPTTTTEQDLRSAGQRRINLIWEYTQAGVAVLVVSANILNELLIRFAPVVASAPKSDLLGNAFFLVIGFYFGRTNHARIGDDPSRARSTLAMDDR